MGRKYGRNPQVRRGSWFEHNRYITADREPEVCVITQVRSRRGEDGSSIPYSVCFRVGGKRGAKRVIDYRVFESIVLRWIDCP